MPTQHGRPAMSSGEIGMIAETKWILRHDLFGALHVFDEGGDRITNDRMSGTQGWEEKARLMAAAPDMYEALTEFRAHYTHGVNPYLDEAFSKAVDALSKAGGHS